MQAGARFHVRQHSVWRLRSPASCASRPKRKQLAFQPSSSDAAAEERCCTWAVTFRGGFRVDAVDDERWRLAVDVLGDGELVVLADIGLRVTPGRVTATAVSAWSDPERISALDAHQDLSRAARTLHAAIESSPEFGALVADRDERLEVVVDYESGQALVASSEAGQEAWADGAPLDHS